jgi:hypothetical protein
VDQEGRTGRQDEELNFTPEYEIAQARSRRYCAAGSQGYLPRNCFVALHPRNHRNAAPAALPRPVAISSSKEKQQKSLLLLIAEQAQNKRKMRRRDTCDAGEFTRN